MDGMIAEVTIVGQEDLLRLLLRAGAQADLLVGRLLKEEADLIFRESQAYVPLKDGPLKNSGRVTDPVRTGADWNVMISYGSTAVQYALYQHEGHRQDGSHVITNHTTAGTKTHYLSDPFEAAIPDMAPRLAMKLQEILDTGL